MGEEKERGRKRKRKRKKCERRMGIARKENKKIKN